MSLGPLSPLARRPKSAEIKATAEQIIERAWNFLEGISARSLKITGVSPSAGQALVASDSEGRVSFSSTLQTAARASQIAQAANVTDTLLAAPSGEYLVLAYLQCTTAGAAGTIDLSLSYTDDVGAVTGSILSAPLTMTVTGHTSAIQVVRCASGGLDYTAAITGGVGNPKYTLYIEVLKLR